MEGLKFGWTRPQRSDTYHYISDFSASIYDTTQSLCGKYHVDVSHAESKQFLQKFEILDTSIICHICEIKLQQRNQNSSKKEALDKIRIPKKKKNHDFAIKKISCSEKSCGTSGFAFVSVSNPKAKHYCIEHNKRVQDTNKTGGHGVMASIEIHCINGQCMSENVNITNSIQTREDLVEHHFCCNDCKTTFVIMTEIMDVKVPKVISP